MTNGEHQVEMWHDNNFGPVDRVATCRKLVEEVGELFEAIACHDRAAIYEEAGDVLFVLSHIVRTVDPKKRGLLHLLGVTLDKVETARHKAKRRARATK